MELDLKEFAKEVHQNAIEHGWWEEKRNFSETAALIHSEISEALEEYRAGRPDVWYGEDGKPEGIAVELIDCVIRIFDYVASLDTMEMKHSTVNEYMSIIDEQGKESIAAVSFPHIVTLLHFQISCAYSILAEASVEKDCEHKYDFCVPLNTCIAIIFTRLTSQGIDIDELLQKKHEYNKTRSYRHGNKVC